MAEHKERIAEGHIVTNIIQYCKENSIVILLLVFACAFGFFWLFWSKKRQESSLQDKKPKSFVPKPTNSSKRYIIV